MSGTLTVDNINAHMRDCKYDVRGEIYLAAVKRTQEGKEVIYTNVGNPHALGTPPITFGRQVLSLLMAPFLMEDPNIHNMFPADAIARAKSYLKVMKGGVGAYTDSKGNPYIRQEIANFIEKNSGSKSNPNNIFISNGASEVARMMLFTLIRGGNDGIMVPIPQYPLYSASIALYGGQLVPYYLDEDEGWSLNLTELQRSLNEARGRGVCVRALVFINPGNPTGQCLSEDQVKGLIHFCYENRLVLVADEVYQENIYNSRLPFVGARAALARCPEPARSGLELCSLHTVSKGAYGECGLRGGYMEVHNVNPAVVDELYKIAAINLCSNMPGQVALGIMVNPPQPGDESYPLFKQEKDDALESLKRRAKLITDAFNSMEGVTCQPTDGAMYSFPRIRLPPNFLEAARAKGKAPDVLYCLELLDETGLSCVPGSGFKQKEGTFHLRTTILPHEDVFDDIVARFRSFHEGFMRRYSGNGITRSRI
jgi:glutamate--glyoxylate aminotransferase